MGDPQGSVVNDRFRIIKEYNSSKYAFGSGMGPWTPIKLADLQGLLSSELAACSSADRTLFESRKVEPYLASIQRPDSKEPEHVFVVARNGDTVMYYEDVEEGFNLSPISREGSILEPGYEQDTLSWALAKWKAR